MNLHMKTFDQANTVIYKKDNTSLLSEFHPMNTVGFIFENQYSLLYWPKKKTHIIIAIDAKKAFNKIQYLFMKKEGGKKRKKLRRKGSFPKLIKGIYKKHIADIIFNSEKTFPLRLVTSQWYLLLPLFFNVVLEILFMPT